MAILINMGANLQWGDLTFIRSLHTSPRFLCRPTAFFLTCWSRGTSESSTYGKQRIFRCNSTSTHFHISWLSDFIFYPKPLNKSLHQSFFYSFITILPSESGVTLHYSTILPQTIISPCWLSFSNLQTWSRDTNWMMTATHCMMELLNAACQIICIRKQQPRYKAYSAWQTVPSTAQIRAEGNNTKCVGKKRFNGSVTHGLRKTACATSSPSHFGQGKIIYANHLPWYIAVIVVFSKSRDKCLKMKVIWRNNRV